MYTFKNLKMTNFYKNLSFSRYALGRAYRQSMYACEKDKKYFDLLIDLTSSCSKSATKHYLSIYFIPFY